MENWPSEFLQLLTFVVLTTYLVYRGSHESKDQDDEVFATLQRIESRLDDIERHAGERAPRPGSADGGRDQRTAARRETGWGSAASRAAGACPNAIHPPR